MSMARSALRLTFVAVLGFYGLRVSAQDAVASGSAGAEDRPDFKIADIYLEQARLLLETGEVERAARFLEVSLEFLPDYSESLFLYARIYLRRQETYHLARDLLRRSVSSDTWLKTERAAAAQELARLEVSSGRFREAMEIIRQVDGGGSLSGLGGRGSPQFGALWARCLIGLGEKAAAETYLKNAAARYPHSPELLVLLARVLVSNGRRSEAREVLGRGIREMPAAEQLLYQLAGLEAEAARRLELLDRYFRTGGSDPGAALLALTSRPAQPLSYLQRFFDLGGNRRIDYLDALREYLFSTSDARLQPLRDRFVQEAGLFSGERILDGNGDGLYEEKYTYERGLLVRWELDENQDGREEAAVLFEKGLPAEVLVASPPEPARGGAQEPIPAIEYRYSEYPYLQSVSFVTARSRREYRLFPRQFSQPVFSSLPASTSPPASGRAALRLRVRRDLLRDERIIRQRSYQMAEYLPTPGAGTPPFVITPPFVMAGTPPFVMAKTPPFVMAGTPPFVMASVSHLLGGLVVRIERDPDPRGRFTHTVYLNESGPVAGERDLDGDGRYELRESYRDGRLWRIALDQDGDGREEFIQIFEPGYTRSLWDYNNDGRFDSSESSLKAGPVLREFSSRLDGSFDLAYRGATK